MNIDEFKKHYRTGYNFNKETGLPHRNFYNWLEWGYIPLESQRKIEYFTKGELKADKPEWEK